MLHSQLTALNDLINEAMARVGMSPRAIADDVMPLAFPLSLPNLQAEGGEGLFRDGLVRHIKRVLDRPTTADQRDLSEIDGSFGALVERLPKRVFFVPSLDAFVWIGDLIQNPPQLDEARKFTRMKGEETLATAAALDQLYAAVIEAAG